MNAEEREAEWIAAGIAGERPLTFYEALAALAAAVGRLVDDGGGVAEWWEYRAASWGDPVLTCIGCGGERTWDYKAACDKWRHDSACPALAIDAAFAQLAALADDDGQVTTCAACRQWTDAAVAGLLQGAAASASCEKCGRTFDLHEEDRPCGS